MRLVYLAEPKYGGWVTYTAHLALSIKKHQGYATICKEGKSGGVKEFSHGLHYYPKDTADLISNSRNSVITAVDKHHVETACQMISYGARLVIHDPNEFHPAIMDAVKKKRTPVITIRDSVKKVLSSIGVESTFVPHPFISQYSGEPKKTYNAVAFSRIDFDKKTEIIVEANKLLPPEKRIILYGAMNRMYAFLKLNPIDANWEKNYAGTFPKTADSAEKIAAKSRFTIDLSVIKNDGGGTQYTFLEAFAQKSHLIIHRKWLMPNGVLKDGINCTAVESAEELVQAIGSDSNSNIIEAGFRVLDDHKPEKVAKAFIDACKFE